MIIHLGGAGTERLPADRGTREVGAVPRTALCDAPLPDAAERRVLAPYDHPAMCPVCLRVRPRSRFSRLVGVLGTEEDA